MSECGGMVYTADLKSVAFGIESSSLSTRTKCPCGQIGKGSSLKRSVSKSRFESEQGYHLKEKTKWGDRSYLYAGSVDNFY